nr:DnaD domain protein [Lachnospiraceae bacterium]
KYKEKGFTDDALIEATKRTIQNCKKLNYNYLIAILNDWHEKDCRNILKIKELDKKFYNKSHTKKEKKEEENIDEYYVYDNMNNEKAKIKEILKEDWCGNLKYPTRFALMTDGTMILVSEIGKIAYCPPGRFSFFKNDIKK